MSELTVSLYGFARGQSSPAYYGYYSPDFAEWVNTNSALPHGMLIRCMTNEMLDGLPSELRDERWNRATRMPGWLF